MFLFKAFNSDVFDVTVKTTDECTYFTAEYFPQDFLQPCGKCIQQGLHSLFSFSIILTIIFQLFNLLLGCQIKCFLQTNVRNCVYYQIKQREAANPHHCEAGTKSCMAFLCIQNGNFLSC